MAGMAEGVTHVHWRRVLQIIIWVTLSLVPVCLLSAVCLAQGQLLANNFFACGSCSDIVL